MGKKGRHKPPVNKRRIASTLNSLVAEAKRHHQKKGTRKKSKFQLEQEELRRRAGPVLLEIQELRKQPDYKTWAAGLMIKGRTILPFLEWDKSPVHFIRQYSHSELSEEQKQMKRAQNKKRRKESLKELIESSMEEFASGHTVEEEQPFELPEDLEGFLKAADKYTSLIEQDPENFPIVYEAQRVIMDWDQLNDAYKSGESKESLSKREYKKSRRDAKKFHNTVIYGTLATKYGSPQNPQISFELCDFDQAKPYLSQALRERTKEEAEKLIDIFNRKKEWYIAMKGKEQTLMHLSTMYWNQMGTKKNNGEEVQCFGMTINPEVYHHAICENKRFRKMFMGQMATFLRQEENVKRLGKDGVFYLCQRPVLDDKFLRENEINYWGNIKAGEHKVHVYGIRIEQPYNEPVTVDKKSTISLFQARDNIQIPTLK